MNIKWAVLNKSDYWIISFIIKCFRPHRYINLYINFNFCSILCDKSDCHACILFRLYSQFMNTWFSGRNKHLDYINILTVSSFRSGCHSVAHHQLYKQKFHPGKLRNRISFKNNICYLVQGRQKLVLLPTCCLRDYE
jgi:hypothetical protein